jgi:CheY-like chemotaxis protein
MWCKISDVKLDVSSDPADGAMGGEVQPLPNSLMRDLAHELRDALSPVASSLDLLKLQNYEPQASRATSERIGRGLRRALSLLETFVLADEAERGTLHLEPGRCGLNALLAEARSGVADELARRCHGNPAPTEVEVSADREQSARVLGAVLHHANQLAAVDSTLSLDVSPAPRSIAIGFMPAAGELVDERCFTSWRSAIPGIMALRTARRVMQLQDGALQLDVSPPEQRRFVLTFAMRTATVPGPADPAPGTSGQPRVAVHSAQTLTRILIVDDSAEVRKAYREALLALGYTVTEAVTGEQALASIEQDPPDAALIDIHLPQMNGYRLAQTVKSRVGTRVRLIMLSGMTMDALTRRLSREAGFDDCLDKMAGPAALHHLLQSAPGSDSA